LGHREDERCYPSQLRCCLHWGCRGSSCSATTRTRRGSSAALG
jgi:hypothetical protein